MAGESPAAGPPPDEKAEKRKKLAKRSRGRDRGVKERGPKSLAWRKSLPDEEEDPFALFAGGEGGLASLPLLLRRRNLSLIFSRTERLRRF